MTSEDLDMYLQGLGLEVEAIQDANGAWYTLIRDIVIARGSLTGLTCDVAIVRCATTLYVTPSAIHTRPAMLPMGQRNTQASALGVDWQYWSRRLDRVPTPHAIWTHVLTVLGEV